VKEHEKGMLVGHYQRVSMSMLNRETTTTLLHSSNGLFPGQPG